MGRKEMRLRSFEADANFDFLDPEDRYLLARPTPTFRFGIIGTGTIGQEHMRVCALSGRAAVGAVYDDRADSIRVALRNFARHGEAVPTVHTSLKAICADDSLDALVIATPNYTHADIFAVAARSGKAILLEKPIATTLGDARRIAELARDTGAHVRLGMQYRFKAIYREAFDAIFNRGSVGTVQSVSMAERRPPFLDKVGQWNKFNEKSGGTLVEKCCHYFDLMNRVMQDRPAKVFATGAQAVNYRDFAHGGQQSDILDHAFVVVDYAAGGKGAFALNMFAPGFAEEMVVCGDAGQVRADERINTELGTGLEGSVVVEGINAALSRRIEPRYPALIEASGHSGATYTALAAFLDELDGKPRRNASISEGLWAMLLGTAAQQSIDSGEPVSIDALIAAHGLASFLEDEGE